MKKKIIALVLAIVVLVGGIVGGTIAYLQDVDSDVNVMTTGNVYIKQLEYERVVDENGNWVTTGKTDEYGYIPDELQEFTQNKKALPAVYQDGDTKWDDRNGSQAASGEGSYQQSWAQVGAPGSNQLFDDSVKNVVDKFVFVENTGKSDAYYRTWIAIECPTEEIGALIHTNTNSNSRFTWSDTAYVTIDGVNYLLMCATYNEILAPKEVSRPTLLQVFLDPKADNDDSNAFGDTWEILVMSQAVQADGFDSADQALDAAFGDNADVKNNPWEALLVHGTNDSPAINEKNVSGKVVPTEGGKFENLTILDNTTDYKDGGKYFRALFGNGITGDLTVNDSYLQGLYAMNVTAAKGATAALSATGTTFDGWVSYSGWTTASFTDCIFVGEATHSDYAEPWVMGMCRVQTYGDTTFTNCEFGPNFAISENATDAITITLENCYKDGVLVTAENFDELLNNTELNGDYCMGTDDNVTIIVNGETALLATYVESAQEVKDALTQAANEGKDTVIIDAAGSDIGALGLSTSTVPAGTTVTIKNATVSEKSYGNGVNGTVVFEDCTFERTDGAYSLHFDNGSGNVILNNCTLSGWCSFGSAITSVELNDCTIKGNGIYAMCRFYQNTVMNNCVIDCSNTITDDQYTDGISAVNGATVTMNDCELVWLYVESAENAKIVSDGKTLMDETFEENVLIDNK